MTFVAYFAPNKPQFPTTAVQITSVQLPQIATETGFMLPASVTLTNSNSMATTANVIITSGSTMLFSGSFYLPSQQTVSEPCYFNANLLPIGTYTCTVTVNTPL